MMPLATACWTAIVCGWQRYMNASISIRPAASAAANIASASTVVTANGFSHRTCFPAFSASIVQSRCIEFGNET
jgi:hypothetical protein